MDGRHSPALSRVAISALVLLVSISATASAQLRSGGTTRSLYRDSATQRSQSQDQAVQPASYRVEGSVLEPEFTDELPRDVRPVGHHRVVHSDHVVHHDSPHRGGSCSCSQCNSACDSMGGSCFAALCSERPLLSWWCRTRVRVEVPLFWRRAAVPPPLVTSAPVGTPSDVAGRLGQNSTRILLGDDELTQDANAGFRITLGTYFGPSQCYGLHFRYWNAGDQDDNYHFNSSSTPILARPFFNTTNAPFVQDTQLIAFPDLSVGRIDVQSTSSVDGLELFASKRIYRDRFKKIDWLMGYQRVAIDEGLIISSNTTVIDDNSPLQGASIAVSDNFQTENRFHGLGLGLQSSRIFGCLRVETLLRLGCGNLNRKVMINGTTTTTSAAGAVSTEAQGLHARNTNAHIIDDDTYVTIPEVGINIAVALRPGLDFNVGYNYMMIPNVAQASHQFDDQLAVNLSDPLVGALDPTLDFDERRFWLHSLGLGLQLRY